MWFELLDSLGSIERVDNNNCIWITNTTKPYPKRIIFNDPATIVFWTDDTKTIVKCSKDEKFSPYFGFLAALAKKIYGNNSAVQRIVGKWIEKDNG